MFLFGKKKSSANNATPALDFKLDPSLFQEPDPDNAEGEDSDFELGLDDPELLAELNQLNLGTGTVNNKSSPKKAPLAVMNVEQHVSSVIPQEITEDVEVEFTEADMRDPELLGELAKLTLDDSPAKGESIQEKVDPPPKDDPPFTIKTVPNVVSDVSIPDATQIKIHQLKTQALQLKRQGNREMALEYLKQAKMLESQAAPGVLGADTDHHSTAAAMNRILPTPKVVKLTSVETEQSAITIEQIEARQREYERAALGYKKANLLLKAREMLSTAKSLQSNKETLVNGGRLAPSFELPPAPASPSPTRESSQKDIATSKSIKSFLPKISMSRGTSHTSHSSSSQPSDIFQVLSNQLDKQIDICTKLSAYHFKGGRKDEALTWHKVKKGLLGDKDALNALRVTSGSQPPAFSYAPLTYQMERNFPEIPSDELEVFVLRAWDLAIFTGTGHADWPAPDEVASVVHLDLGWPTADDKSANPSDAKAASPVIKKQANPEYNYSKKFKITRNKAFQRHLERRSLSIEVHHTKSASLASWVGMSSSSICLGKVQLKLNNLLNHSEIHDILQLNDPVNPRKTLAAKLELRVRLRMPLLKPHIVTTTENWLSVHFAQASIPPSLSATPPFAPHSPELSKSSSSFQQYAKELVEPKLKVPSPASREPSKRSIHSTTSQETPLDALDEIEMEFYDPENIISNHALEMELKDIIAEIGQFTSKMTPIPDELVDRKQGYELRMNTLVTMVQIGSLSLPEYAKKISESIARHKQLALSFKKGEKMQLAKKALIRIKRMQDELATLEPQDDSPATSPLENTSSPPADTNGDELASSEAKEAKQMDLDELELEFNNPDNLISNHVLEVECNELNTRITAFGKQPVPEELQDRLQAYMLRMNVLVTMVQMGTISMPGKYYIQKIQESIDKHKYMALAFKKGGKMDSAKKAMIRIKQMQAEVASVQEELNGQNNPS